MPVNYSPPTSSPSLSNMEHGQKTEVGAIQRPTNDGAASAPETAAEPVLHNNNEQAESLPTDLLPLMISFQSLLGQFSHPQIRAAFLNGQFQKHISTELLPNIDELRCSLFPRWRQGGLLSSAAINVGAVQHLHLLVTRSDNKFITNLEDVEGALKYSDWFRILEQIADDPYWGTIQPNQRCCHILPADTDAIPTSHSGHSSSTSSATWNRKETKAKSELLPARQQKHKVHHKQMKKTASSKRIEEIIISSSGESDSSKETGAESDSEGAVTRRSRLSRRQLREKRDVVTPPVYVMDGKVSLKNYLTTFEEFFHKKYDGNNYDKTQTLSTFLTGELLDIFEAKGGRKLAYPRMKEELLAYYKKQRIGGRSYWRNKLDTSAPEPMESLSVYGAKLVEIAELAYPGDRKESALQVRKQFLKSIPSQIAEEITHSELIGKLSGGKRTHMTFADMVEYAQKVQKSSKNTRHLMMVSSPAVSAIGNTWHSSVPQSSCPTCGIDNTQRLSIAEAPTRGTRSASASRVFSNTSNASPVTCGYCKRLYHTTRECWRAAKLCLICGNAHNLTDCPRYNPQHKAPSQSQPQTRPLN